MLTITITTIFVIVKTKLAKKFGNLQKLQLENVDIKNLEFEKLKNNLELKKTLRLSRKILI